VGLAQKYVLLAGALSAGYLVFTQPKGFLSFASGVKTIVGGTDTEIVTGGKA
jgi:hypothetical protein